MESSSSLISLSGRRVVITGAAAGIGRAMGERFADAGAGLVLVDVDEARLKTTVAGLPAGSAATTVVLDLADPDAIDRFWETLDGPEPDTLINNAGIFPMRDFLEVDRAHLARVLDVNLESMIWMCQRFIARRRRVGGVIINLASIEALVPFTQGLAPYSVSKAGVLALTRSLARDYGRAGFRVNAILPGGIRTPGTQQAIRQAITGMRFDLARTGYLFNARLPLGRWGKPDEVARVALFLASDLASYVQGTAIPVDGGFLSA